MGLEIVGKIKMLPFGCKPSNVQSKMLIFYYLILLKKLLIFCIGIRKVQNNMGIIILIPSKKPRIAGLQKSY